MASRGKKWDPEVSKQGQGRQRLIRGSALPGELLVRSIKIVIQSAIKKGGSTLNDFYSVNGQSGYFQNEHKVYARENQPCTNCDEKISQIRISQRSSFYCNKCQV